MSQTNLNPGHLVFIGVTGWLDVQTAKFHVKTMIPGHNGSLLRYEKQKEKVLIFLTTALLLFFLASAASASSVITPSGGPSASPSNPFYYTNITVTSNDPTYNSQSNILDLFGGSFSTLEAPGRVIFADYPGQLRTYDVFFTTHSPVSLTGYSLYLAEDGANSLNRSATNFELLANGSVISNVAITATGQNYAVKFGADSIKVSDSFAPVSATTFEAIFTSNIGFNNGIRVLGFQGVGGSQPGVVSGNPEPSTISLALLAGLAFAAFYRRRIAR
jgi:hypothetical protein